jgi:hypothetical protein
MHRDYGQARETHAFSPLLFLFREGPRRTQVLGQSPMILTNTRFRRRPSNSP